MPLSRHYLPVCPSTAHPSSMPSSLPPATSAPAPVEHFADLSLRHIYSFPLLPHPIPALLRARALPRTLLPLEPSVLLSLSFSLSLSPRLNGRLLLRSILFRPVPSRSVHYG
eukprot:5281757-Pleurochrysis_carterae.AAC.1